MQLAMCILHNVIIDIEIDYFYVYDVIELDLIKLGADHLLPGHTS